MKRSASKGRDDAADAAWFTVKLKKGESRDVTTDAAVIKKRRFFTGTGK